VIELFEFQRQASQAIADRFIEYFADPVETGTRKNRRTVPFFQALQAITASGKTAILADAVSSIAATLAPVPVVLWLSKGKVVVEQTYANLLPGGKYHHLLDGFDVQAIAEYNPDDARSSTRAAIYFATVGTFNVADRTARNRLIYRCDIDDQDQSTWDALRARPAGNVRQRRPLIIVYDEAHNISDQQTDLLMQLEPDAFLLASATMRLPARLGDVVAELKHGGKTDAWLVTNVDARAVSDAGLVKSTVSLAGYKAPMEETVAALLHDMAGAERDAINVGLDGAPKAIYVANTNIVESNAFQKDDPKRPFKQRQAPPIVIWRYLTETCKVDPATIAVYCSLSFHKTFPPPPDFTHFKGGETDYDAFVRGDFRHIIFNLSLQEGWDDPLVYFAYIDKSMESRVQVEQLIGRVLRQPGVKRYPAQELNTAHLYVRVDRGEVFSSLVKEVEKKLASEAPEVRLIATAPGSTALRQYPPRDRQEVPSTAYDSRHAVVPVAQTIESLSDYRTDDGTNTQSEGARMIVTHRIGDGSSVSEWEAFAHASQVSARWVFQREVLRRFRGALDVASTAEGKFDARLSIGSKAYNHVVTIADQVVNAYVENVHLVQKRMDPYVVGPILCLPDELIRYTNSVHEGYDRLNSLEKRFAAQLDQAGLLWCRNPAQSGFGVPLITVGTTRTFYPDFLIWNETVVLAVDTKAGNTLPEGAARKLLRIQPPAGATRKLIFRFFSEGTWSSPTTQQNREGFTIWGIKQDGTRRITHLASLEDAMAVVLDPND
jgi:type III restriction enzyme